MGKKTILIVDDASENIDLLVGLLKDRYTVKAARSGEIALKIAQSPNPPDLVLLDIMMPGMDGFEVCKTLKVNEVTAGIPIIFVSGKISDEDRTQGNALGATAYLTKPIDPNALMSAIDGAIIL